MCPRNEPASMQCVARPARSDLACSLPPEHLYQPFGPAGLPPWLSLLSGAAPTIRPPPGLAGFAELRPTGPAAGHGPEGETVPLPGFVLQKRERPDDESSVLQQDGAGVTCGSGVTTVMIRNVGIHLTRAKFVKKLHALGLEGKYDFVHMPMTFGTAENKGIIFVNFTSEDAAVEFSSKAMAHSPKGWRVFPAAVQGLEANMAAASAGKVVRIRNHKYKPLIVPREA